MVARVSSKASALKSVALISVCIMIGRAAAAVAAEPADPQVAPPNENIIQEVVVTSARKRAESVQVAPVAVTALSDKALAQAHAINISDVANMTPNLQITQQVGTADVAAIYLRGFGVSTQDPSVDPAIAVYVDGVYEPHVTGTMLDLFDVSKVEVLRGPQGTLLGKNSPSGAVAITTKRPSGNWDGEVQVDYGRFDRTEVRARFDAPIIRDVLAAKVSIANLEGGDYIRNLTVPGNFMGGDDILSGRVGLLFTPTSGISNYLSVSHSLNRSPQYGIRDATTATTYPAWAIYAANPAPGVYAPQVACLYGHCDPSANPPYTTRAAFTGKQHVITDRVSNEFTYHNDAFSLALVSGYANYDGRFNQDIVSEPEAILNTVNQLMKDHALSQELRVSSQPGGGLDFGGKLDWVAGLYYYRDRFVYFLPLVTPTFIPDYPQDRVNITEYQNGTDISKAAFAHLEYKINADWSVSAGARQTWDHKDHAGFIGEYLLGTPYSQSQGWSNLSGEFGVKRTFSATKMAYARVAQGYRGGGFDGFPGSAAAAQLDINPEKVVSSELGLKADWLDERLRTNVDLFFNSYTDLQRSLVVPQPQPPGFILATRNAARAHVQGVEIETTLVPLDQLTIQASGGFVDAHYLDWPGDPLGILPPANPNGPPAGVVAGYAKDWAFGFTPRWTFSSTVDYRFATTPIGKFNAVASYTWRSDMYAQDTPSPPAHVGGMGLLNGTIRLESPSGKYAFEVYGRNLTNRRYITDVSANGPLFVVVHDGMPITWGLSINEKF